MALLAASVGRASAARIDVTLAGLHVVVWAPAANGDAKKQPVLLFSHGYGGCAMQSNFLMEALAADGFWVFAPDHRDARCGRIAVQREPFSMKEFRTPADWNDRAHVDRRDDLVALLAAVRRDPAYRDRIDFSRLGLLGHSLGGYTVLGLAGAWQSWRMDGVKAVLALSPYSEPFNLRHTIQGIAAPVMFQGGTLDFGTTPDLSRLDGSYQQARVPKYYVEFQGAGHFVWTDLNTRYAASIDAYARAFLDHYVKDEAPAGDLTRARGDVAVLRFDSELGQGTRHGAGGGGK